MFHRCFKSFIVVFVFAVFVVFSSSSNAAVYFITKPDTSYGNTQSKSCPLIGYSFTSSNCPSGSVLSDPCPQDSRYFKTCGCDTKNKFTSSSCKAPNILAGASCNDTYFERCDCDDSEYKYDETNCPSPKVLNKDAGSCTSKSYSGSSVVNGKAKYKTCSCPSDYSKTCTGDMIATNSSESCDGKYKSCKCDPSKFPIATCTNGEAAGTKVCTEENGSKKYQSCKANEKQTCQQWVQAKYPAYTFVTSLSADHYNNQTIVLANDIKTPFTSNSDTLNNLLILNEASFNQEYSECTKDSKLEYVTGGKSKIILNDTSIRVPFTSAAGITIETNATYPSNVSFYKEATINGNLVANSSVEFRRGGFVNKADVNALKNFDASSTETPAYMYIADNMEFNTLNNNLNESFYSALFIQSATVKINAFSTSKYTYIWLSNNAKLINGNGCSLQPQSNDTNITIYSSTNKLFFYEDRCPACASAPFCCSKPVNMSCGAAAKTCEDYSGYSTTKPMNSYYYCPKTTVGGLSCYKQSLCRLYTCSDYSIGGADPRGMCAVEGATNSETLAQQACKNAGYSGKNFTLAIKKTSSSADSYCFMCYPFLNSSGNGYCK